VVPFKVNVLLAKAALHDTNISTGTDILADTSDTRDFLKLFLWQAERGSRCMVHVQ